MVRADAKTTNGSSEVLVDTDVIYYMSVIPETEAKYHAGAESMMDYITDGNFAYLKDLKEYMLRPGSIKFTVTAEGKIDNVIQDSSCGFLFVDDILFARIKNMPGHWKPAKSYNGQNVDQQFVFFYGKKGC